MPIFMMLIGKILVYPACTQLIVGGGTHLAMDDAGDGTSSSATGHYIIKLLFPVVICELSSVPWQHRAQILF